MKIEIELKMKETGTYGTVTDMDWEELMSKIADHFWWKYAELQQLGEIR